jgi:coenzyme PQQ synthesis protein D (PqqD)
MVTLDSKVAVSEESIFRELEGESVVLNLETGMYYGLDEVGTEIWRAVEETGMLRQALDRVLAEFDTDRAAAESDLLELAQGLLDKGLWKLA